MFSKRIETLLERKNTETYAFLRALRKEVPDFIPKRFPLVSLSSFVDHISVYKNIQFDTTKVKRKIWLNETTFKPTLKIVKNIPLALTEYQYLKTSTHSRLTSFLVKYLDLKKHGFKDNEIRDLAQKIMHNIHKGLTDIVVCDTPEDHVTLYEVHAYSCMSPKGRGEYSSWLKTYLYKNHKLWPSMWYHYNPHTKGIFLQFGNRGVARAILIRQNIKKPFKEYYRNIYAESSMYRSMFVNILRKKKISQRWEYGGVALTSTFKVPAIQVFSKPICPLPFYDCMGSPISCKFNKKDNTFSFGPYGKFTNLNGPYHYKGYIDSDLMCAHETISRI